MAFSARTSTPLVLSRDCVGRLGFFTCQGRGAAAGWLTPAERSTTPTMKAEEEEDHTKSLNEEGESV